MKPPIVVCHCDTCDAEWETAEIQPDKYTKPELAQPDCPRCEGVWGDPEPEPEPVSLPEVRIDPKDFDRSPVVDWEAPF